MLVRAFCLRGGIPIEAAQTNVYCAPESRADIARSIRTPIHHMHSLAKKRGATMPSSKV